MNRVRLLHVTEFDYDGPVSESYNEVRLQPYDDEDQHCVGFRLHTQPTSSPTASRDYFGNWVHRFNVMPKQRSLRVELCFAE
jgi:transglutaminase-like putative cysteine protease